MSLLIYWLGDLAEEDTGLKRHSGSFWAHRIEPELFIYKLGDPTGEDTGLERQSGGF